MGPLAQLLIEETPTIIDLVQGLFAKKHPDEPVPTSQEIIDTYEKLYTDSIAKDEMIKAANQ